MCLAYPFGNARAFKKQTQRLAQEAGYRAAFSYYGGANEQATMQRYDHSRRMRRGNLLWRSERAGNNAALRPQAGPNYQAKPCPLPGPNGYPSAHRQFLALIAFLSSGSLSQFRLLPEIRHLQLL